MKKSNASLNTHQNAFSDANQFKNSENDVEEFLRLIINASPDIIFVKDSNYKIIQANPEFMKLYPEEQQDNIIGHTTVERYNPEEAREFLKYDQLAFEAGQSETLEKIQMPSGQTKILYTKKVRFQNIRGEYFILGISRDVTERENLISKLKEHTHELEIMNQELDDFAYIASHDLKAPLRGIYSYASSLLEDYQDKIDDDGQAKLQALKKFSKKMDRLLTELLDYSRVSRKKNNFKEANLQDLLCDVLDTLKPGLDDINVRLRIAKKLPTISCEAVLVSQVFTNLIMNAAKYNDKSDKWVEVGVHTAETGELIFYVKDNGIGIKEKYHDSVFKIFKRLNNEDTFGGGTGFGLTITQKIIEQHGGKIWLESELDKGSTFYFTLKA